MPAVDMTSSGVSLLSGDVMNVQLSYNGTTLTLTITDATTSENFTTSWAVNIPTTVGSTTALVGFTGSTGGTTAVQDVLNWTYGTGSSTYSPPVPTNVTATVGVRAVGLSWSAYEWSDQLQREAVDDGMGDHTRRSPIRRRRITRHRADEWDDVLRRGVGSEHVGGEAPNE